MPASRRRSADRGQVPDAGRGQGDLAALQYRRDPRRHPASRGRLHPARRSDAVVGARRARARRGDQPPHDGHGDRAAAERRMESLNRQGRHHLRACRLGDRQFRAPNRPHGRNQRAGDPGRAPIYRHRGASRDRQAQGARPAGNGRAARIGFRLVHARGGGRLAARTLRKGRAGLLCRRAVVGQRIRAFSRGS